MDDVNSRLTINLRAKKQSPISNVFFKWVINSGRIIVVVVELLALGALGYRFTVDQQIIDLHDRINRELLFVNAQAKKEKLYRSIQKRLANIETVSIEANGKVTFLKQVLTAVNSPSYSSTSLNVNNNTVTIDGQAVSIFNVGALVDKLKQNPNVTSISIDELASSDQGIRFKITATLADTTQQL